LKTIALIDTLWYGHHPTYIKIFSKTLLELGHKVIVFCPEPSEVNQWISLNCQKHNLFHAFELKEPKINESLLALAPKTFTALLHWKHTATAIQRVLFKIGSPPDLVFFAWLDSYLSSYSIHYILDKIFPYNWSGLYFRSYQQPKQQKQSIFSKVFNPYTALQSSHCKAVAILNEYTVETLQSKLKNTPVIVFPDFTDESLPDFSFPIMKQIQGKAAGRKIIALLGSLDKRKGFLTLLEVSQKMVGEDYFFVFAGKLGESSFLPHELIKIQNIVNSTPDNCFFHFERIPDEAQFNSLVYICDILFAGYNNFPNSSNILTKAAIFKKPVIVSNNFCMEKRVKKFCLGLTINEGDTLQCIDALKQLCFPFKLDNERIQRDFEGYKRLHSTEQLYRTFSSVLDNA
jgi:glycosyltransferase involved in cell wall biosynthesis